MMKDFFTGAKYIFSGCCFFYNDKKTWKYTVFPLTLLTILYSLVFWFILHFSGRYADLFDKLLAGLPKWLSWVSALAVKLSYFLGFTLAFFILSATMCTLYEWFGGIFFDFLVEYYEKKEFGIVPCKNTFKRTVKLCTDSILLGIRTTFLFLFFLIFSMFLPVIGQVLMILVLGYEMGINYMVCSAANIDVPIKEMRRCAGKKFFVTLGFGVTSYILLMNPLSAFFLLPGIVLGGAELFNRELRKHVHR